MVAFNEQECELRFEEVSGSLSVLEQAMSDVLLRFYIFDHGLGLSVFTQHQFPASIQRRRTGGGSVVLE